MSHLYIDLVAIYALSYHIFKIDMFANFKFVKDLEKDLGDESIETSTKCLLWVKFCIIILISTFLCYFMFNALMFCFVDPLKLQQFGNWVHATILPFLNACLTFALWIFGIFKTVFHKIKTKAQNVFSLFYN